MSGRRVVIGLWLICMLAAGLVILRSPVSTDMSAFLPSAPTSAQRLLVDQLRDGPISRLVLVEITQAPAGALAPLSRAMAAALRADDAITLVSNGDQDAMGGERDVLWRHRYLLSPAVDAGHFSPPALRAALQKDIALLGSDIAPLITRVLPADPTLESLALLGTLSGRTPPRSRDGVWVSRDGANAVMMLSLRAASVDIDGQERALTRLRRGFEAARDALPDAAEARLVMTGPPVFAVQTRARIKGDAERLSLIAIILVSIVLLVAYRSPRVIVLALLPMASGALVGIAAVGARFGMIHGITLGFGVTLIGEAVDYAIYLFSQTPPGGRPGRTLPRIWPTLRLGMLTSVCGFSAMLVSDFAGFAQLGVLTIAGLLSALAVTRWVLPALLPEALASHGSVAVARPLRALMRHAGTLRPVVLVITLASLVFLALRPGPVWENDLASMSPVPPAEVALDTQLRGALGAPDVRFMLLVTGATREAALVGSERANAALQPLLAAGVLGGSDSPATWLPSEAVQRARLASLPDAATLRANLDAALTDLPLRGDIFAAFVRDIEAARQGGVLRPADLAGTSLALQLDSLLLRRGADWIAVLPLHDVADAASLERAITALHLADTMFLDLKRESDHLLIDYRGEALSLSAFGCAGIVLLLAVSLRAPRRIVAVLLPLAAAVICTAAALLAARHLLSIFHLFGLLLVVAVGSNYCLFFERHAAGGQGGDPARMITSLVLANLCTVIGFGILSFSRVPVLNGIGGTVAIGAFLSLVFGAIVTARPHAAAPP